MTTTGLARQDASERDIAIANREDAAGALAHVLGTGDLSKLSNEQRVAHYLDLCQSLSLNPRSRPFDWIEFYDPETKAKKLTLYPKASCADQLRRQHHISAWITRREIVGELFVCEAEGQTPTGRKIQSSKYVPLTDREGNRLRGQRLANAMMKAETGVYRRLTFAMIGMAAPPDIDELARVKVVTVDGTGRIIDNPTPEQKALAADPSLARVVGEPVYEDQDASGAPLAGTPDQRATAEELTPPARASTERPSFKNSDEQIEKWRRAWFGTVKGLSLDSDEARAAFVSRWTADEAGWPEGKRTDSLRTMFARMTAAEAGDLLAHVRALCDDERRELLAFADQAATEEPKRSRGADKVRDSVELTGGPAATGDEQSVAF